MRHEALFINGVYRNVLEEILQIQEQLAEHIMYLQPYSGSVIKHLQDNPPSPDEPMLLLLSLTDDLPTVHFAAEIVGWEDKRQLSSAKRDVLNRSHRKSSAHRKGTV